MRRLLGFLLRDRGWKFPVLAAAICLILLWGSLLVSGSLSSVSFNEEQNSRFEAALNGQPRLPAMAAARDRVDAAFADRMRAELADTANLLLQSPERLELEGTRPIDTGQAQWVDTYVCGLEGWRDQRPVLRKLVVDGFGECGWRSRFAAKSPIIYSSGGRGWVLVILLWTLLVGFVAAALLLRSVRRAYDWLYASKLG